MDVEWSTVVELEHPWYQGVKLYTISSGAEHNSESHHRKRRWSVIYEGDVGSAWEWC